MKNLFVSFVAALGLSVAGLQAQSRQPFEAVATNSDIGIPVTVQAGGDNLFDFMEALVNTQGPFQALRNRAYSGSMTFLGVADAVGFATNNTGTSVTITLRPINFNRTFTGPNSQAVDDQIEDFFKREGGDTIARFLQAIAKTSPIAVTDGNPTSSTAIAANVTFLNQGFTSPDVFGGAFDPDDAENSRPKFGGITLGLNAGKFEAGAFEGTMYDFTATLLNVGGEKVRLMIPVSANFLELDAGSQVAGAGANVVLPIRLRAMSKENKWNWRITPLAGVNIRGSVDLASLSPLWQVGVVNAIDYKVAPKLVLCLVNQLTVHRSFGVEYDDLDFDPDIDQQILKNGVRFVTPLSRRVLLDGFVIDTRFLKDAAVDQFWSFGASLAFRATRNWNLVLGSNYDSGDDFKAYSVGLSSAWKW